MAIAFDNTAAFSDSSLNKTFSYTVTGSNTILFVGFLTSAGGTISTVTYAGVSMTASQVGANGTTSYYLINPATGANNLVVTWSGGAIACGIVSYTGAKQSSQPDNSGATTASSSTSVTNTLTSVADNCWHTMFVWNDSQGSNISAGTGTTKRTVPTNLDATVFDNNAAITPAGSNAIVASGNSQNWWAIGFTIAPAPPSAIKTINGLARASVKTVNGLAIASMKSWNDLS